MWEYPATAQFFWLPLIILGMGKATNFKFGVHIHSINRNISPLKILGKVASGVVRDSRKFSGHPYIGRIPQYLCDSSAFLFLKEVYFSTYLRCC